MALPSSQRSRLEPRRRRSWRAGNWRNRRWGFIAIIAALTRTQHAVTTTMKLTGVAAGIVIDCVAVVTSFVAINPLTQVASDHAIATSSQGAIA